MENTKNQVIIYKEKKKGNALSRRSHVAAEKYRDKEFPHIWLRNMSVCLAEIVIAASWSQLAATKNDKIEEHRLACGARLVRIRI